MKRSMLKTVVFVIALLMVASVGYAAVVQGVVKQVDQENQSLMVMTSEGESAVSYSADTTWPEGVISPAELEGKEVAVTADETSGAAVAVDLA